MKGYVVTLTSANTNYNLLTLVRVIDSTFVDQGDFVIQVEDDGGAQVVKLGGSDLDATHYGFMMTIGDTGPHYQSLAGINVRSSLAAKKILISVGRPSR